MKYIKILIYFFTIFVICELLFRLFNPLGIGYFNGAYKYLRSCKDTGLGYYLNANVEANSYGLRGSEIGNKDKKRILLIGDSVVYGLGIKDNETFAYQLQCSMPDYEIINAGVGGWNTENEYLWLKYEGIFILDPDIVILFILNNDVENIYAGKIPKYPIWQKVCYNSYVLSSVFYIKRNLFKFLFGRTSFGENTTPDGFDKAKQALEGIIELAKGKLIICMYGNKEVQQTEVMQFYLKILKENKVPGFFLPDNFYSSKYRISTIDHHPNPIGHQLIANAIQTVLSKIYEQR